MLGPVYFMENVLNVGFSRLTDGVLVNPLSAGKPLDQVHQWAGDEIADMFQRFEDNTDFLDAAHPGVTWHSYADWARTVDWDRVLHSPATA